jgi:hypothetical protein
MPNYTVFEFDHHGRRVRVERRGNDWAVILNNTLIDRIPANVEESPNSELEMLARQVVNSHLESRTPGGF